ncbi:oligosaccharide flippase family protein [Chitinibacter bivalviorum]|uniref:Oligosaccharide flippase family protein n=1 Tax=Chitinibacter bivalviorum TaxID=2739434 RepID=A0A7H9BI55_9NEIS|nr:oligosaccharide flippase family protein [Chitinibacter bivalviorum]QLG88219.1 oligosaccharide flippase family protein [Chitinibacter bivalviorum]
MTKATTQRVRQSMLSMLIARPISAVGGLLVLVFLSRLLQPQEYAIYFAIWAVAEIAILASNLGLLQAAYRYISASELSNGITVAHGPVVSFVVLRIMTLLAVASVLAFFPSIFKFVFPNNNISEKLGIFVAAIIVGEGLARYIESIFDSMLCQGRSQISLIIRTVLRLVAIGFIALQGELNIQNVVYIEVGVTLVGALVSITMLAIMLASSTKYASNDERIAYKRMLQFALPAFIAQLLGITYGPDALKITLAGLVGANALAVFGFAYSLAAVVQRYIPANILAGVFRPIFVAASKKEDSDKILPALLSFLVKINWIFIAPIFCGLFFSGDFILSKVSAGNYPAAGMVLSLIVLGLLPIAMHATLSMYCLAKETSWAPLYATALSVLGLPIAIYLGREHGAVGVAIAFGVSELIWSITCYVLLARSEYALKAFEYHGLLKILNAMLLALLFGYIVTSFMVSYDLLVGFSSGLFFFVVIYFTGVFSLQEKQWLASVLPAKLVKILRLNNA